MRLRQEIDRFMRSDEAASVLLDWTTSSRRMYLSLLLVMIALQIELVFGEMSLLLVR